MYIWDSVRNLPKNIWLISIVALINRAGTMVLPFMALYLTQEIGIEPGKAGLVLTFYGFGALISAPFAGKLSDKIGPLNLIRLSLFSSGFVFIIFPIFKDYFLIAGLSIVLAIVSEAFRPAGMAFISNEAPVEQRKQAYALYRLAINLGMSIGPVLGGLLSAINFSFLFYVDGITSISAGIFLILAKWNFVHDSQSKTKTDELNDSQPFVLKDFRYSYFLLAMIPVSIVFFQHFTTMPLFVVEGLGFTRATFGLLISINTIIIIFIEVPLNAKTSHWPDWKALTIGSILCAVGFGGMIFTTEIIGLIITIVIWTFGEMVFFPASASLAAEIAPERRRGEYMGYYQMMFSFVFMLAPFGGTLIYESYGSQILWFATFITALISTVMMFFFKNINKKTSQKID